MCKVKHFLSYLYPFHPSSPTSSQPHKVLALKPKTLTVSTNLNKGRFIAIKLRFWAQAKGKGQAGRTNIEDLTRFQSDLNLVTDFDRLNRLTPL